MLGRPVDLYHIPGIVKSCSICLNAMDQAGRIKQCTRPTTPELNVVTDVLIWAGFSQGVGLVVSPGRA